MSFEVKREINVTLQKLKNIVLYKIMDFSNKWIFRKVENQLRVIKTEKDECC